MSLDDFIENASNKDKHQVYGSHEYDEKLEEIIEEYQQRFPVELKIEFVEVSSRMEKSYAKAYKREKNKYYIRVSESFIERACKERIRRTILHEMVHVYFFQKGYSKHGHSKYFRWVVGQVGGSLTNSTTNNEMWQNCIEPFIEEKDL